MSPNTELKVNEMSENQDKYKVKQKLLNPHIISPLLNNNLYPGIEQIYVRKNRNMISIIDIRIILGNGVKK